MVKCAPKCLGCLVERQLITGPSQVEGLDRPSIYCSDVCLNKAHKALQQIRLRVLTLESEEVAREAVDEDEPLDHQCDTLRH
jgi:hypothetical protein